MFWAWRMRGWLNKEPRDHPGHKPCVRSLVRLKKSLLCNPPPRTKGIQSKKGVLAEVAGDKHKSKNSVVGAVGNSLEVQAMNLLLSTGGTPGDAAMSPEEAVVQLGNQLGKALPHCIVGNMRTVFGLPEDGCADSLGVLVGEAGSVPNV